MSMLLLVAGASCAGKTAILGELPESAFDIERHDFDELGIPPNADKLWRRETNEAWVRHAISAPRPVLLAAQSPIGEVLAAPSAASLDGIASCLLDCNDWVRVRRLIARGRPPASQHQLNWAAWHRLHATHPQWEQHVIKEPASPVSRWHRWDRWQAGDRRWQFDILDTSSLTPSAGAAWLTEWTNRQLNTFRSGALPLSSRWWDEPSG